MPRKPKKPSVETDPRRGNSTPSDPPPGGPSGVMYLLPDGRITAVDDVEAMFTFLAAKESDPAELKRLLWELARECDKSAKYEGAVAYLEKILTLEEAPDARSRCFLVIGQVFERTRDFEAAVAAYSRAFALTAQRNDTWYFLNNNLGYSLNQIGRHVEAEAYTRAAIAIEPRRHNARKNLGVSLQGQGRFLEAAHCFLEAARMAPDDLRALGHLEDLLAQHEEIGRDHPEILKAVQESREAVRTSRGEQVM